MSASARRLLAAGPLPPPLHGVSAYTRELLAHGLGEGWTIEHLDTSDHRDAANLGRWESGNLALGLGHLAELVSRCARCPPDAFYLPLSQSVPGAWRDGSFILAAQAHGVPVVVHLHGGYFRTLFEHEADPALRALLGAALARVRAAVVLGAKLRAAFSGLVPEERIYVVPNGVPDPGAHVLRVGTRVPEPGGGRLLYMSTLSEAKGIDTLVEAVGLLAERRPALLLTAAGAFQDEAARGKLLARVEALGLRLRVAFPGELEGEAKARALAEADLFCLPTRYKYEGQPLAILEALAAGLPVISTDHAAIGETVRDGSTGRVLPVGVTPQALAEAIDTQFEDADAWRRHSRNARTDYLAHFTLEKNHESLREVLEKSMKSKE